MNCYVVTTGKGEVWVTFTLTMNQARIRFMATFPGSEIASIVEAKEF